ncbi:hypothetical protein IMSHALPRED_003754 [Imshaugia aleurites]|uniref:Uncharacterized protein n=1 Tax=Imshaugia aleurites TaxID=172621 RepID=A0A8H3I7I5_9LECA|nr:hypothetical protein IMSHALPRED_003754 [Imshaugia aleurites]
MPPRAQTKHALRLERQQQQWARNEITRLQAERHALVEALKGTTAAHKALVETLERIETDSGRWQSPGASSAGSYADGVKEEMERVERQIKECHRRWDELGEEIEEKHVEIAFGGSGGD